jgi:hypothetical protein
VCSQLFLAALKVKVESSFGPGAGWYKTKSFWITNFSPQATTPQTAPFWHNSVFRLKLAVAVDDGQTPVFAEGPGGYFDPRRGLAALVFVAVN